MAKGNIKNLKPRTQEGLQAALEASVGAGDAAATVRKAMMKHGYVAKVVFEGGLIIATSGALRAQV